MLLNVRGFRSQTAIYFFLQGISDGSGAIVLASEEAAKNLKPLARLVGWSYVGVDPSIMGIGPVPAIENLLKVTGVSLKDVDLIEVSSQARYAASLKREEDYYVFFVPR